MFSNSYIWNNAAAQYIRISPGTQTNVTFAAGRDIDEALRLLMHNAALEWHDDFASDQSFQAILQPKSKCLRACQGRSDLIFAGRFLWFGGVWPSTVALKRSNIALLLFVSVEEDRRN